MDREQSPSHEKKRGEERRREARNDEVTGLTKMKILSFGLWLGAVGCERKRHREARHQENPRLGDPSQALARDFLFAVWLMVWLVFLYGRGVWVSGCWHELHESCARVKKKVRSAAWYSHYILPQVRLGRRKYRDGYGFQTGGTWIVDVTNDKKGCGGCWQVGKVG